ncbi:MAG: class A beta-lactamase [bacterium]|nr:class A beta-lactamase [bacterium]
MNIKFSAPNCFKKNKILSWGLLGFLFSSTCCASLYDAELAKKIDTIEKKTNTIMGISAIYIEQGKTVEHNSDKPFFMASTIKLPIAVAFLHRVDEKKDSLNRVVQLDTNNSVPGSGTLYHLFEKKSIKISMQQILKYTLMNSDNSASDTLLQAVNGPQYVMKRMNALGFKNILINRSILEMFLDTNHVDHSYLKNRRPVFTLAKAFNNSPVEQKTLAWQRFQNDIRDTTTPGEMAKLLVKIYKNQALSAASTKVLLNIMEQCRTGRSRIKGLLPANVKVAHKTGTWAIYEQKYLRYPGSKKLYRFASDVGIITLPHNKGHIAIAVYVKSQAVNDYARARAIALVSRAVYDHFMKSKDLA